VVTHFINHLQAARSNSSSASAAFWHNSTLTLLLLSGSGFGVDFDFVTIGFGEFFGFDFGGAPEARASARADFRGAFDFDFSGVAGAADLVATTFVFFGCCFAATVVTLAVALVFACEFMFLRKDDARPRREKLFKSKFE
jgi:hypothetical protein